MRFQDIPGHDDVKERLRRMAEKNRLPHAILLEGNPGLGKLALAQAFASYIQCTCRTPDGDSCGVCASCRQHKIHEHIDTLYVFPVIKKSASTPAVSDEFMAEWRNFIDGTIFTSSEKWSEILNRAKTNTKPWIYVDESDNIVRKLAYTARNSEYRVVIIWQPERLNETAANKILKILEEPYPDTIFVLVSDDPAKILPTIYSRLQRIEVKRYTREEIAAQLIDRYNVDDQSAAAAAHISDGNMLTAIQVADETSTRDELFSLFKELMRLAYVRDVTKLRDWAYKLAADGRDKEIKFYEFAMRLIRENFIYNFNLPELNYLTPGEGDFSKNFARFITENNVEGMMKTFEDARSDIYGNANGKMVNLDVAIRIILLIKNG